MNDENNIDNNFSEEMIDSNFFDDLNSSEDTQISEKHEADMSNQYSFRQIGSIAKIVEPINGENTLDYLVSLFNQQPELEAVPIEQFDHVVGVISRAKVENLTKSAWKRLVAKNILAYIDRVPQILNTQDYIEKTVDKVSKLNRESGVLYFPVFRGRSFYGLISLDDFLSRVAEISAQDLEKAKIVQTKLLDSEEDLNTFPFVTSIYNRMANAVGGDFYITHKLSESQYILGVFDVSGKNIAASLLTVAIGSFFKALRHMLQSQCTHEQLTALFDSYLQDIVPVGSFITAALCYVDISQQRVYIQNCGHSTIYVYIPEEGNPENIQKAEVEPDLPPLGMGAIKEALQNKNQKTTVCLPIIKGMHIELYSDGLTDMQTPESERYEEKRALEFFEKLYSISSSDVTNLIEKEVQNWIQHAMQADDITVMDIRF